MKIKAPKAYKPQSDDQDVKIYVRLVRVFSTDKSYAVGIRGRFRTNDRIIRLWRATKETRTLKTFFEALMPYNINGVILEFERYPETPAAQDITGEHIRIQVNSVEEALDAAKQYLPSLA